MADETKDSVLSIRFPTEVVERLRKEADEEGVTVSAIVRRVAEDELVRRTRSRDPIARYNRILNALTPFLLLVRERSPHTPWLLDLEIAYEDVIEMLEEERANQSEGTK